MGSEVREGFRGRGGRRCACARMQWEPSGPTRARCGAASASRVAWQQVSWATLDAEPGQRQRAGKPRPPGAMAKKPMSTAEAERMNLVAQDQIW